MTLDLGKVNMDSLRAALDELGQQPNLIGDTLYFNRGKYVRGTGEIELEGMRGQQATDWITGLKQRIAVNNATSQAKKMGWGVKRISPTQIQLTR